MLHRLVWLLVVSSLVGQATLADELTTAKFGDIKRLMEVTGSASIGMQFASASSQQVFRTLKTSRPEIPDRALAVMDKELMALFSEKMSAPGGLIDLVIPVYHKYFTHQEIRELLAFYQTRIGKKTILVMPNVVNESMMVGQRWGQSLGPEIER